MPQSRNFTISDRDDLPPFDPRWSEWPCPGDQAIREALLRAHEDGSWGRYHGPNVEQLEAELAAFHEVPAALSCASGTIAVQIALRSLNLPDGSEVILAAYDFPGNFRAIQDSGLFPVLVDINPRTWCLDVETIEAAITEKTSAVIVSHLHGGIADMPAIREMADRRGIAIVEDACQAPGARLHGKRLGTFGDVGVLSFGGSKLLTAGRGGAILTERADVLQRAKIFCERGNHAFPLSELQAAVIRPQLKRLDQWNQRRWSSVQRLRELLASWEGYLSPIQLRADSEPAFYKHAWLAKSEQVATRLVGRSEKLGLPVGSGFRGFTKRPSSQARKVGTLNDAENAASRTVLLHHPILMHELAAMDWMARWFSWELAAMVGSRPDSESI
ncbi:DegT/DnrJ/EryC1/StrS family aminotransferase [Bremerella volcania]|uniref:DegT/DnrJ/EryC1/StrS family aminotransferase n=1 Tax=Bremerella volcania TaxID=2527984 RepID=UPI0013FD0E51|nr:aminotransferase class V-fold PLP-dependent enzyme [Bremerella volcania]